MYNEGKWSLYSLGIYPSIPTYQAVDLYSRAKDIISENLFIATNVESVDNIVEIF